MSRTTWALIKRSKRFYTNTYRRVSVALLISSGLNVLLVLSIYFTYFTQPAREYYSTNGVTAPVILTPREQPNNAATPLLRTDTDVVSDNKIIPR